MAAETVLVVDDDPLIVRLIQMVLEVSGYQVITAADGVEGLERVRADRPSLVVLDVMMPRMDGLDVTRAIKAADETRAIPVILLSAKTAASDIKAGQDAGADEYMTKPFDNQLLVDRVAALIEGSS